MTNEREVGKVIVKNGYGYQNMFPKNVTLILEVPLIDTGHNSEQKIVKMREEIDELLNEFCMEKINTQKAFEELHDVIQVMSGYLLAKNREECLNLNPVKRVKAQFVAGSALHHQKMKIRAAEQNWVVIAE